MSTGPRVETAAKPDLPDVFDPPRVMPDEAVSKRSKAPSTASAHPSRLASPSDGAILRLDPDEQPARRDIEGLDAADLHGGLLLCGLLTN
jgi:hypothetical protein